MTRRKQAQRTLWEGVVEEDVRALYEPWMIEADRLLEDESLIDGVFAAQGERHEHSATKGRSQTPAEMVLRLLLLKHVRNWSFDTLEREVRANLVYRDFTRIGMGKVPDAKTLARIAQALGGEVIAELHRRLVEIAQEEGVIQGRKLRVDTTVVETNIHYPTDSSLLGDGARVLTRTMKKIETRAGQMKRKVRNRMRSISKRVVAIATASRHKGPEGEAKRKKQYRELLRYSRQILNDAKRVIAEVEEMSTRKKKRLVGLVEHLTEMADRVRRVVKQAKARVFDGITQLPGKIVSLFEPHSEIIRKGKASKPTEFGKLVQVQEAEQQIITHYDVFDQRPSDHDLLLGAVEAHERVLGRVPRLATADAGYYSQAQEQAVEQKGVKWVAVPNRNTKSAERKKKEHSRWFKQAQRWRTGCEGRISVLKRRHGLSRCRYRGAEGMKRWVGLGVMADTLISMGNVLATRT
ncbi:MAG: ISNCY family transposase [Acidobacteria bacterium Pan2503]|uniref:ISNCY family transposase n=1 Tax=Candidatus Acidiferrum panamense TaxID=2741543 RepID=A0A7V8NUF8_9BACT|nr:ISNCY family transposase [Candidatus Acidoferrum panamensis]